MKYTTRAVLHAHPKLVRLYIQVTVAQKLPNVHQGAIVSTNT